MNSMISSTYRYSVPAIAEGIPVLGGVGLIGVPFGFFISLRRKIWQE